MKTHNAIFFTIALFFFSTSLLLAQQNWLWSNGGNGNDEALANAVDLDGNIYTTGYFSLSAKFDTTVFTASGSGDIFVSKQKKNGQYLWTVKAGGPLSDRAYGISVDAQANILITGFFSNTAIFGADTISSANGSLDIFVAKLDSVGNFLWAKSFGGADIDIGLDVHADAQGNAIVTGQFRGHAQFGSFSFTSMNDTAGRPSYDIFIMKLDTSGNVIWAKQGAAKFDDRGLAVSTDAQSNIYFTGQYSDTLTLDNVYPGVARSVGFVAKMDSGGNIIWLRPILASQVLAYNVQCFNNNVYISGDFQGQLVIFAPTVVYLNKPYLYKIFVALLDSSGTVTWASCDGSDNPVSALSMAVDNSGSPYLAGTFNCVMTEYSSFYGTGVFNSIGFRDIFISKFDVGGTRKYERQFGGPEDDFCSAISISTIDKPVIAGSFGRGFNIPNGGNFVFNSTNYDSSLYGPNQPLSYCSDTHYSQYISVSSNGNKDIFSTQPIDLTRAVYDYFDRGGNLCVLDSLLPFINNGSDTIIGCDSVRLFANRRTGRDGTIGPEYEYHWSNGSIDSVTYAYVNGMYYLHLVNKDNCRKYDDSAYVIVYNSPPDPDIATTIGTIRTAIPDTPCNRTYNKLIVVFPDTATLYCPNVPAGYIVLWNTPYGTVNSDSTQTLLSGAYTLYVTSPQGNCQKMNCIEVIIYDSANVNGHCLPNNFKPEIHFTDSTFDITDTVRLCKYDFFNLVLVDSATWAAIRDTLEPLYTYVDWTISGGYQFVFPLSYQTTFIYHFQKFQAISSGLCSITAVVENPISGGPLYIVTRSFYLDVLPNPPLLGQWHGPTFYCPGDTVLLTVTGGTQYQCSGPGIVWASVKDDSIRVTEPGTFECGYIVIDTTSGCFSTDTIFFQLSTIPAPHITMIPSNGVICPNDSVELIAESGTNYSWTGPMGNTISHSQSIWVSAPGYYHYDFTDTIGCTLVSEFKEVKTYSTPYLIPSPGSMICVGGSVLINVQTNDSSLIQWLPPFSGNSMSQTVDSAGTYSCSVSSCGITTIASITITVDIPPVHISIVGNPVICPGDTVLLQGNAGMAAYEWQPGNSASPSLFVFNSGSYSLTVTDYYGCTATDSARIDTLTRPPVPASSDVVICSGDSATLTATATGTVSWYASLHGNPIASGNTYTTTTLTADTIYYVSNYDSVCHSARVPVHVTMNVASLRPAIIADTSICSYDSLQLTTIAFNGAAYHWSGPFGFSSSFQSSSIFPVDSTYSGYYFLQVSDSMCTSPVDSIFIRINGKPSVQITASSSIICPGISDTLFAVQPQSSYLWMPGGSTNSTLIVTTSGTYFLIGADQHGCADTSQEITITVVPAPPPPQVNDTSICIGSSVTLTNLSNDTVHWFSNSYLLLNSGNTFTTPVLNDTTEYYILQVDSNGCRSAFDSATVYVSPLPPPPVLTGRTSYCTGDTILINSSSISGATYHWSGPNGFTDSSPNVTITNCSAADSGSYLLTVTANGCGDTSSFNLIVYQIPSNVILSNSPICVGQSLHLFADTIAGAVYSWQGPSGWSSTLVSDSIVTTSVSQSGYYSLQVTANGCKSNLDSLYLKVVPYPVFYLGNDTILCIGNSIILIVPTGYDLYHWNDGSFGNTITVTTGGAFLVTVTNLPNCSFSDSIKIDTMDCMPFFPNVFTPNGDGYNDYFYITYERAHDISIVIFDRWGKIIKRLSGSDLKWDGKVDNGAEAATGVYYYVMQAINYFGKREEHHGYIELIR